MVSRQALLEQWTGMGEAMVEKNMQSRSCEGGERRVNRSVPARSIKVHATGGRLQGFVQPQMEAPCLNRGRCVTSHADLMHAGRGVSKQVRSHEIVEGIDCLKHTVECSKPPAPAGAPTTPSVRDNQRPSQPKDARARESPREPARTRIQYWTKHGSRYLWCSVVRCGVVRCSASREP